MQKRNCSPGNGSIKNDYKNKLIIDNEQQYSIY